MKIALADEMRTLDRRATKVFGIPSLLLMENAGRAVADTLQEILPAIADKQICVLMGSGNNGGDALVAARHLHCAGAMITVFCLGNPAHFSHDTACNAEILQKMSIPFHEVKSETDEETLQKHLSRADAVIDGLLGTGFQGTLRTNMAHAMQLLHAVSKKKHFPVLAIDVPSGVETDTGNVSGEAVQATCTVTFVLPKLCHYFAPGAALTGRLVVRNIGMPPALLKSVEIMRTLLDEDIARKAVFPRAMDAYKGSVGRILVIAGSEGMTGAARLASKAALSVGAGIVTLTVPRGLASILEGATLEVMTHAVGEAGVLYFTPTMTEELLNFASGYDLVLLGPGLGRHAETMEFVRAFCAQVKVPLLLDADAIFAYKNHPRDLQNFKHTPILTPHLGEMANLLGIEISDLRQNLLTIASQTARTCQATFVVKSERTVVAYPDGQLFLSSHGNPGMATAGSGDVLAGAIAGFYKNTVVGQAPLAGVWAHGMAGDSAAASKGYGLLASDILAQLPFACRQLFAKKTYTPQMILGNFREDKTF